MHNSSVLLDMRHSTDVFEVLLLYKPSWTKEIWLFTSSSGESKKSVGSKSSGVPGVCLNCMNAAIAF